MKGTNAWLIALVAIAAAAIAFGLTIAVPLTLPQQQALDKASEPNPPTSAPTDGAADLAGIDVNLKRPLADPGNAESPTDAAAACVLLGTSIDSSHPMALVQLPDGSSRWLSLNETTPDGFQLTRVDRRSATIGNQRQVFELRLPGATP